MSEADSLYIGLMSGTSADSIDAVLVDFSNNSLELVGTFALPYETRMRSRIFELTKPSDNEIDRMGAVDIALGKLFAKATISLLQQTGTAASAVRAIGSHGQTIRHRPQSTSTAAEPFSLQIGDPNTIAEQTGITTVADFRRRDMAAGGQGAPLTPAFHKEMFSHSQQARCILNIGGMANVTYLPTDGSVIGFDTGPGNVLMDAWIHSFGTSRFDHDGTWAASGHVNQELLQKLLSHSYFRLPAPKSTGREEFDLSWVNTVVEQTMTPLSPQDVQATLAELTAVSISDALKNSCEEGTRVFICGGGMHNKYLIKRLSRLLAPAYPVASTEALNLHPDWVEAVAFAWMAMRTLQRKPSNLPPVTGASEPVILGGVYYA